MSELADVAAERGVLAGICQYGLEGYIDIADTIDVDCFTFESNEVFFKCLEYLIKDKGYEKIDLPSVLSAATDLKFLNLINKPDERTYIRSLFNFPIKKENISRLAGKIKKISIIKKLKGKLNHLAQELNSFTGDEPINKILSLPETTLLDFSNTIDSHNESNLMGEGIDEYLEFLTNNQRETVGISTGMSLFDKAIGGGLLPGVNLVGARPKIGKTTLGDNVALHIANKLNIPVLNLDSEMSKKNHWDRILANLSNVSVDDIRKGRFAKNSFQNQQVKEAAKLLKSIPYSYESVIGMDMETSLSIVRRWLMRRVGFQDNGLAKPCVIVYDYLKLASENSLGNDLKEYQVLGFQINALHNFLAKYEIPCLALIQLNRDGINRDDTDVISGSDRQVWTCTSLCLFKKKTVEEMAEDQGKKYNRKLVPIVARFAEEWEEDDYINLQMQGQFARIVEGESRKQLSNNASKGELVNDPESIPTEARQF